MRIFLTAALALLALTGMAQTKTIFYLKYNGNKVATADSADYIRVITPPDSASTLFNVTEYYVNGKRKLIGKSPTIDPPAYEGQCATFYTNGNRASVVNFSNGTYLGNSYLYYPDNKLHAILSYDTLTAKNYDLNFKVLACNDSAGKPTVTDGNGHFIDYNLLTKTVSEEGDVKNGSPDGEWHGSYPAEKITYTDTYRNAQFVSGVCTMPNGVKYTYTHKVQSAEYRGGDAALIAYLKKKAHYQAPAVKPGAKRKSVLLTMVISREGKPLGARLFGSYTPAVNNALINAANTSAGWKPALQNGRPIDAPYNVAVTL